MYSEYNRIEDWIFWKEILMHLQDGLEIFYKWEGGVQNTLNFGGYNYFTPEDLQTIIGAPANGLQNYHLYGKNGEEMSIKDGGFSQVDLLQDVDAYNISKVYNLADTKLYAAFEIIIMCQNTIKEDIIFLNSNC